MIIFIVKNLQRCAYYIYVLDIFSYVMPALHINVAKMHLAPSGLVDGAKMSTGPIPKQIGEWRFRATSVHASAGGAQTRAITRRQRIIYSPYNQRLRLS